MGGMRRATFHFFFSTLSENVIKGLRIRIDLWQWWETRKWHHRPTRNFEEPLEDCRQIGFQRQSNQKREYPPSKPANGRDHRGERTGHQGNKIKNTKQLGGPLPLTHLSWGSSACLPAPYPHLPNTMPPHLAVPLLNPGPALLLIYITIVHMTILKLSKPQSTGFITPILQIRKLGFWRLCHVPKSAQLTKGRAEFQTSFDPTNIFSWILHSIALLSLKRASKNKQNYRRNI